MNDSASCKDTTTCPHKEEKKEFVKDYHQHWEGYEVTCKSCGKFLRWEQK